MSRTKLPIKIAVATARFVVVALASSTRAAAQTETDVFNFDDAAGFGETPNAPLIFDAHGNLYGTTSSGGANSSQLGVAFELNPAVGGGWTETILHSFTGGVDGEFPLAASLWTTPAISMAPHKEAGATTSPTAGRCSKFRP